ncbi:WXG100 family type VII secretion target [Promicromonospora sp. Populi]|uniref:WXG100 family type VII secretion target n=1 Tax=Promicromonospora sp. Populi TaxID=3239420 RepID=UPI0034E20766
MSGEMYGADIEALRLLADRFDEGSGTLDTVVAAVEAALPQEDGWSGPDADGFRQEWTGSHLVRLKDTAAALSDIALTVRANADAQETTSNEYVGGGPGGWPGGGELGNDEFDWNWGVAGTFGALGLKGLTTYLAASKAWKTGTALASYLQATRLGDAAKIADATVEVYRGAGGLVGRTAASLGVAEDFGLIGKMSTAVGLASSAGNIARFAGTAGGIFGVVGGLNQMFNTQYDGARGWVDRGMGVASVIGGGGGIAIALGAAAFLGPVGVGVVVGAGLVAGAWALGNMVYDNWDTISGAVGDAAGAVAGAAGAAWDWAGDTAGDVVDGIGNMADAAGDAVSDVGDAVGDGLEAAGDFVGGLFS